MSRRNAPHPCIASRSASLPSATSSPLGESKRRRAEENLDAAGEADGESDDRQKRRHAAHHKSVISQRTSGSTGRMENGSPLMPRSWLREPPSRRYKYKAISSVFNYKSSHSNNNNNNNNDDGLSHNRRGSLLFPLSEEVDGDVPDVASDGALAIHGGHDRPMRDKRTTVGEVRRRHGSNRSADGCRNRPDNDPTPPDSMQDRRRKVDGRIDGARELKSREEKPWGRRSYTAVDEKVSKYNAVGQGNGEGKYIASPDSKVVGAGESKESKNRGFDAAGCKSPPVVGGKYDADVGEKGWPKRDIMVNDARRGEYREFLYHGWKTMTVTVVLLALWYLWFLRDQKPCVSCALPLF